MGEEPHSGLEKANNAYISAKLLKVLGNDILGKQLTWKVFPNFHITVAGVFEDFRKHSSAENRHCRSSSYYRTNYGGRKR